LKEIVPFKQNFKAMKTIFLFAFCLVFCAMAIGQEKKLNPDLKDLTLPEFNGKNFEMLTQGKPCASLNDYLRGCLCYPNECIKQKIQGTEVIEFEVTPEGKLKGFHVVNSLSPEIDEHVTALLKKTSGMWSPGKIDGVPVTMKQEVSVAFKWSEFKEFAAKDFTELARSSFEKGSKLFFVKNQPEKALKHFNKGLRYLPGNESLLLLRGICRLEMGDQTGARQDWERMKFMEDSKLSFKEPL
jgi:hypothetical protein